MPGVDEGVLRGDSARTKRWPASGSAPIRMDDDTLFFLGKLDLNYVWLQLGPLQQEDRLGRVLGKRGSRSTPCSRAIRATSGRASPAPGSTTSSTPRCRGGRARVLGSGNQKKALTNVREGGAVWTRISSRMRKPEFALWDITGAGARHVNATDTARQLAQRLPGATARLATFACGSRRRRSSSSAAGERPRIESMVHGEKCGT